MPTNEKTQCLIGTHEAVTVAWDGRPVVTSGIVYKPDGTELISQTNRNVSLGWQGTVSGVCGVSQANRRLVGINPPLTSGLFVGQTLRIENSAGQWEFITVKGIPDTRVQIDEELMYDYAAGNTIEDPTSTFNLLPTDLTELGTNYRIRFITINRETGHNHKGAAAVEKWPHYEDVLFDVVAHKIEQPITTRNLQHYDPVIEDKCPEGNGRGWHEQLETAWSAVYEDFVTQGIRPSLLLDEKQLARLHLYKFKQLLSESGIILLDQTSPLDAAKYFKDTYTDLLRSIIPRLTFEDKDEDLAADSNETNTDGIAKRNLRLYF